MCMQGVKNMIKTTVTENGFEGVLFPTERTDKVLIVVSGSNGGITMTEYIARFYQKHGIPALAVALFKTKGTQKNLDRVPLEYIESAIKWLKEHGYNKIGMDGTSKGSEITLLAATMFSDISCVIARVPSHFVSEGLVVSGKSKNPSGTSSWSYKGVEIPYARYNSRLIDIKKIIIKEKELHLIDINSGKNVTEDTLIPVEKIQGPVLLLSSVNDSVWPSNESGIYIDNRLDEKKFAFPHKHIAFPHMSHAMLTEVSLLYKLAFKTERQNKEKCTEERIQLAKELINWVDNVWDCS